MVILGVTFATLSRNLKCSSIGWSENPTLPVTAMLSDLVCTPSNWIAAAPCDHSTPSSPVRKSKCHHERRNSPSVTA